MADRVLEVICERTFRTGRQVLFARGTRFYMAIWNRTYHSVHEVPSERVPLWIDYFYRRTGI